VRAVGAAGPLEAVALAPLGDDVGRVLVFLGKFPLVILSNQPVPVLRRGEPEIPPRLIWGVLHIQRPAVGRKPAPVPGVGAGYVDSGDAAAAPVALLLRREDADPLAAGGGLLLPHLQGGPGTPAQKYCWCSTVHSVEG
jgi:hypothetical protein